MEETQSIATRYWHVLDDGRVQCDVCPRGCRMHDGQRGLCFVRGVEADEVRLYTYGRSSGFCVDPIEKKPLNHFLPGTSVLSFGTAGCNLACKFCFPPETLVATTRGMRPIAELFDACPERMVHDDGWIGFPSSLEVWTRATKPTRVAKVFAHSYSGDLVSIKGSSGPPIVLTPNHKVFAAHRSSLNDLRPSPASELTTEHYLVVPKRRPGAGARIVVKEILQRVECREHAPRLRRVPREQLAAALAGNCTSRSLGETLGYHPAYLRKLRGQVARDALAVEQPRPVIVSVKDGRVRFLGEKGPGLPEVLDFDPDLAWLLGLYCAEGSVSAHHERPNSCRLVFSYGQHEHGLVAETARLLSKVLGVPTSIVTRRTTTTVECGSTSTARLFEALCGKSAKAKRVPAQLTQTPEPVIRAFLNGYFAGDGYAAPNQMVGGTVSRNLAFGLYELGLHVDLLPTFFVHQPAPTTRIEGREVSQATTYIVKFKRDRFEGHVQRANERTSWRDAGDSFLVPIRRIERVPYAGMVYNLEVEDPEHSYLAPFLAVSNCQNWDMSKSREMDTLADRATPEMLANAARRLGCSSVAYTYNDPVIFMEYAIDVADACREQGIKSVAVTAGYMCPAPRAEFYRHMDAANVDLKAFNERFYRKICGGELGPVLETLEYLKRETNVWLEITTLLIPDENDSDAEIDAMTRWIADRLGPDVPLHFTAFHPDWKMTDKPHTPPATLTRARAIALGNGLRYTYTGNVHDPAGSSTYCPGCGQLLIERDWYELGRWRLDAEGACLACGARVPGVFAGRPGDCGARRFAVRLEGRATAGSQSAR